MIMAIKHHRKSFGQLLGQQMIVNPWDIIEKVMILTLSFIFTYTLLKWRSLRRTSRGSSIYLGMIQRCLHLLVLATYMQPQYLVQEPWWEKSTRFLYTKRRIQPFHLSSMLLRLTWLNSWMNRQHSVKMVSFLVLLLLLLLLTVMLKFHARIWMILWVFLVKQLWGILDLIMSLIYNLIGY